MPREITGILVTTEGDIKKVTIEDELDSYYEILNCDCIDCTVRRIGSKEYDIVCDDEGLLKEAPVVTAITSRYGFALVGNLFICNHNSEGYWTSLSEDEIQEIMGNRLLMFSDGKLREVIQVWA